MKLTKHQKAIVKKILSEEVCDIPSYIRVFQKGKFCQYDMELPKAALEKCENGNSYIFKQDEDGGFHTEVFKADGSHSHDVQVISNSLLSYMKESPLTSPVKAELDIAINPEQVAFKKRVFSFDFLNNRYLVADSFSDIIDFIALWTYLKNEALIVEVNKQITDEEISVFFESHKKDIEPEDIPRWKYVTVLDAKTTNTGELPTCQRFFVPSKPVYQYLDSTWAMNYDHLTMCKDFIGKRILVTSSLDVYSKKRFKTFEERTQSRNLLVAWIAVIISFVAVIIGNIVPLFQPSETDVLNKISQQLTEIEERIDIPDDTALLTELSEIKAVLTEHELKYNYVSGITSIIDILLQHGDELLESLTIIGEDNATPQ